MKFPSARRETEMYRVTDRGRWQALAALGVGLLFASVGCWSQSTKPAASSGTARSGPATTSAQCESVLSSIEDISRLSSLGRTTAVSDGVARLNDWSRSCGPAAEAMTLKLPDDVRR